MELAKKHISELKPASVKTSTLFHLKGSKYVPDFFGMEWDWTWIIFPWDYTKDLVNIVRKIDEAEENKC